jgi:16S rRNA (adenine1518-N6/adenine1519-N6)-dimethyltransferase
MRFKPKKSLGQNFLIDKNIQAKIINSLGLCPQDIVLEIGAGRGELTHLIAQRVKKVYAVEIDSKLCGNLESSLSEFKNIQILNNDILKLDLKKYSKDAKFKVIGNVPYYITTPIIELLIKYRALINIIFLTVQKEFATRIAASSGTKDYGSFSCFVQYYTLPQKLFLIKKSSFFPVPKVDSCFLRLTPRERSSLNKNQESVLFKIIRASFNQRRKTLRNSLKELVTPEKLESFFKAIGKDNNIRPEMLTLEDFITLTKL